MSRTRNLNKIVRLRVEELEGQEAGVRKWDIERLTYQQWDGFGHDKNLSYGLMEWVGDNVFRGNHRMVRVLGDLRSWSTLPSLPGSQFFQALVSGLPTHWCLFA